MISVLTQSSQSAIPPRARNRATNSVLALSLTIVSALWSVAAFAQSWATVDDFSPDASAYAVKADASGNIFAAGAVKDSTGRYHAVVTKSGDGGTTWATSFDLPSEVDPSASNGSAAYFAAIASAELSNGERHVVVSGRNRRVYQTPGVLTGEWVTVRTKDSGASWEIIDRYYHPTYSLLSAETGPWGVAMDAAGTVHIAGVAEENVVTTKGKTTTTTLVRHWLIRSGIPNSSGTFDWTTKDIPFPTSKYHQTPNVLPKAALCVGSDAYVVGGGGTDGNYWTVLKSSNRGVTWTTSDSFTMTQPDSPALAHAIAADASGNLYVAGAGMRVVQGVAYIDWMVRKGTPGGGSWTTLDRYPYPAGSAWARGVTVGTNGDLYVTGNANAGSDRWLTRKRSALTGSWTNDEYTHPSNLRTFGKAITTSPSGSLFSAGVTYDASGYPENWLVRRLLIP